MCNISRVLPRALRHSYCIISIDYMELGNKHNTYAQCNIINVGIY